ncbi:hypothetical protein D1007_58149 [Hordeum vulgare]|nr:hypothetical protein D1007_58149 [Hordeum vulgare]
MDPTEILNVRFHFGGEFVRIGPNLQYVGGDDEMSEIERDKLSLQEVKGFLKDHIQLKESMKFYFLVPGKSMAEGLMFLNDDGKCVQMAEYTDVGGVADIYVEYHGEQDSDHSSSGSDFEKDEIMQLIDDDEPHIVISAEPADIPDDEVDLVMVPDDTGVITQLICSPVKQVHGRRKQMEAEEVEEEQVEAEQVVAGSQLPVSQVFNPSQEPAAARGNGSSEAGDADSVSESDSDPEYEPHSDDSGENSEVVDLRRHARKFKKKMRDTKSWIQRDSMTAIPVELIANMEEQVEAEEEDWCYDSSDEDYSYDEDSDGELVRRKSQFPRYINDTEIPHFRLTMVFRIKN